MRGVVLAGGTGSRLFPLTKVTNKHLLPVGHYPMLFHPIGKLAEAGIQDILIVTGTAHVGDVVGVLGSGHDLGIDLTYRVQDEAGGIAQALLLARGFAAGDDVAVILGDNIFQDTLLSVFPDLFDHTGARIAVKSVDDPERFGVATIEGDQIVRIVEKPAEPESSYAVTGVYVFDDAVFDIISTLKPSRRGELEITDVNNAYIQRGQLSFGLMEGWWTDAGTMESLARASILAADIVLPSFELSPRHKPLGR